VALRAIELHRASAQTGDVRGIPRLKGRHQLGQELANANDGVVDLTLLDASLFGIGIALLLHDFVHLRRQGRRVPHDQFLVPRGMRLAR
jgi:hypothetical protein